MKKLILFVAILILVIVVIAMLSNDISHAGNNYTEIEVQMRKLWY